MEQTKELTTKQDNETFLAQLNESTGFNQGGDSMPQIKFSAIEGMWKINKGEKDEEGKFTFEDLGKELICHPINVMYQLVQSGDNSPQEVYSKEYAGNHVQLLSGGEVVETGEYKELKPKFDLRYTKVLYSFVEEVGMCRIKLSGFALTSWFPFLNTIGNPATKLVKFSLGRRMKGVPKQAPAEATKKELEDYDKALKDGKKPALNLFWEIKCEVEKDLMENDDDKMKIVESVMAVNNFLKNKDEVVQTAMPTGTEVIKNDEIPEGEKTLLSEDTVMPFPDKKEEVKTDNPL